eukprot:scaffold29835_cov40-Prasinocladus_malaysianus.AAC.1
MIRLCGVGAGITHLLGQSGRQQSAPRRLQPEAQGAPWPSHAHGPTPQPPGPALPGRPHAPGPSPAPEPWVGAEGACWAG